MMVEESANSREGVPQFPNIHVVRASKQQVQTVLFTQTVQGAASCAIHAFVAKPATCGKAISADAPN